MDTAAYYSPRKLQILNQCSPRASARKRSLFPTSSPQSNDLGLISEIHSSDSETYSPAPASPSLSITPLKNESSPLRSVLRASNRLLFGENCLGKRPSEKSPRKYFGKENITDQQYCTKKSPNKTNRNVLFEKQNFNDKFVTILSESPEKGDISDEFGIKSSENFTTPKNGTLVLNNGIHRSPLSASKVEATIKPSSFYGSKAPQLGTNQGVRFGGIKHILRPDSHQPRAKTKLVFEKNLAKKRERSKSTDALREAKRRKAIFTGVHHAIPRPVKYTSPPVEKKPLSIREKACKVTDLSRTPYGIKKKKIEGWEHTLRFMKPQRYDESPYLGPKRKFFKTTVHESPEQFKLVLAPSSDNEASPVVSKKRKLFDIQKSYLGDITPDSSPKRSEVPKIDVSDIRELIEDDIEKLQSKPEVEDILLRLEEEDDEEKKKEVQKQMLMNIFEDSPSKSTAIDSLSNCTASLDLNDAISGHGCSRFILEDDRINISTPRQKFPVFSTSSSGISSSGKRRWHGLGEGQLQIDAGQKRFGAHQCTGCGMIYQAGEAEDEMQHESFHSNLSTLRHMGWKNEDKKTVANFGFDYVLMITSDDPRPWQQKAHDVLALVDKHLGITDSPSVMHNHKVFFYISNHCIVGCMVATPVSKAYRLINSQNDVDICSDESYPVRCGISRMWTLYSHRRQGIASKLLDTVRRNFMFGHILTKDDVAFSIPTKDGKEFATKYMGHSNFLVYTGY